VGLACHPSYGGKCKIGVQAGLGKKQDPVSKITTAKMAGGVTQLAEYPLCSVKP
jgi:hypothetical protein